MFEKIEQHPILYGLERGGCAENGICVVFCKQLLDSGGELDQTKAKVIQVDGYYNTSHMLTPPPSIDCFIIVKEEGTNNYSYYLVELRNVTGSSLVKPREILKKFETTFLRFIGTDFADIFLSNEINIIQLKSWLITDPFNLCQLKLTEDQYRNRIKGTVLEQYNLSKPFMLKGRLCMVEPVLPDPHVCFTTEPFTLNE